MEPAERKLKILEAIVEAFIRTGEPVGSKTLCDVLEFTVSPATIRNDMAELASLGLLEQPHTSSGRMPTPLGYRVYIDRLMKPLPLTKQERDLMEEQLYLSADAPENLLQKAAELLASLTGLAAIATSPPGDQSLIRHIRLVQTGRQTAMVVLIASTGTVKTRLFRCDYILTNQLIEIFETELNKRLVNLPVIGLTPAFMQSTAISMGEMSMLMPNVLLAVQSAAKEAASTSVAVKGHINLLMTQRSNLENMRALTELFSHSSRLAAFLLSEEHSKTDVVIGGEAKYENLRNISVIISRYRISEKCSGAIAVIGPIRMNYAKNISRLEYISQTVGTLLNEFPGGS